jgi:site-specific DNA-methyltransferase (adenine-specific)
MGSGLSRARFVGKCSLLQKIIGIFVNPANSKDVQQGKYVGNVRSKGLFKQRKFVVQKIDRLVKVDGEIEVYNLTIDGIPVFSTLVGESHNTQKPIALYRKIYEWYGDYCKGGVLDTFLGSGSNRIAAYDAGYDFVGIELNKVYFEKEKVRFAEHIAKGDMFASAGINIGECERGIFE